MSDFEYPHDALARMVAYAVAAHPLRMPLALVRVSHRPPCEAIALDLVGVSALYPGLGWIVEALRHAQALDTLLHSREQYKEDDFNRRVRAEGPGHFRRLCDSLEITADRPWTRTGRALDSTRVLGGFFLTASRHRGYLDADGRGVHDHKERTTFHQVSGRLFSFAGPVFARWSRGDLPAARKAAEAWVAAHSWRHCIGAHPSFGAKRPPEATE